MIIDKIAHIILVPLLKFWIYSSGIKLVAVEFIQLIRKVSVKDSFYQSFKYISIRHERDHGLVVFNDEFDHIMVGSSKKRIDVFKPLLKEIRIFERFCHEIEKHSTIHEQWTIKYSKKKIDRILCRIQISPHNVNDIIQKIESLQLTITFDSSFNIKSIYRKHILKEQHKNAPFESFTFNPCTLDDIFLMIKLALAPVHSMSAELFPEYYTTTVYDYSSEEFKQRLQLHDMVNY